MTTCFEEGSDAAKICILAEAPGRNEVKADRPLVGASGMLFNDCLHEAGIVRSDLKILNVWEEEVYRDKSEQNIYDYHGDLLWKSRGGFTQYGLERAGPTLLRLQKSRANVICPMGGVALSLLFGDSRILKWRGSILHSSRLSGRKIIPTIHPAFSLRGNYTARYTIIHDLKRISEESETSQIILPKRDLIIDPQYTEVLAMLRDLQREERFATDIEILNHQISCLSFAPRPDLSMCIPFLDKNGQHRWTEEQETEIWLCIAELMENPDIRKINQNILFDVTVEAQQNNILTQGKLDCTMCAQGIMYPDFPKDLGFICSIRTREPYYKDDGKLWSKPWVDMERFWRYNALDSAVALEAWEEGGLEEELKKGYEWTYNRTIELFRPLMFMMVHGIFVNTEKLRKSNEDIKAKIEAKKQELNQVAERPFSPTSPKQCQEYFYVTKGLKPYVSLKTGKVTCDDKALARIVKRYKLPEARLAQEIRSLTTLYTRYLEVGLDDDRRLRCSYNPRGASTGRLSSSETIFGTGLNMQNLHADFKDFLEADPEEEAYGSG